MDVGVPLPLQLACLVAAGAVLVRASRQLPWFKLRDDREAQAVLVVAAAAIIGLRLLHTPGHLGVSLHFLGASIATLMFGPRFALWVMALASLVAWARGHVWWGWGPDFLLTGAVPVALTWALDRLAKMRLPTNVFVYVLVNSALGGGLAMGASIVGKALGAWWLAPALAPTYLLAAMLLPYGEAFFTGCVMAVVVIYRPQWCATFDDRVYLNPPPPPL